MSDFGLSEALGEDDTVKLIRLQRETARRYGQHEVVTRQTAWLVDQMRTELSELERNEEGHDG